MCERSSNSRSDDGPSHESGAQDNARFDPRRNELSFRMLPDSIPDDVSEVTWRMGSEGKSTMPSFGPEDHLFDLSSEENVFMSLYDDDDGGDSHSHPLASRMSRLSLDESQGLYDDDNEGEKSVDTTNTSPKNESLNLLDMCNGKIIAEELSRDLSDESKGQAAVESSPKDSEGNPSRTKPRRRRGKKTHSQQERQADGQEGDRTDKQSPSSSSLSSSHNAQARSASEA